MGGVENGTKNSFHLSKGNHVKDLLLLGFQDIKLPSNSSLNLVGQNSIDLKQIS